MDLNKNLIQYPNFIVYVLSLAIFLIRLPPFYFLPFGDLFMTHNLSSVLIGALFCYLILKMFINKRGGVSIPFPIYIMAFFIVGQSLSIISASNVKSYLSEYKDVIFAFFTFFVSFHIINRKNVMMFINIFLLTSFISLLFQLITYFYPQILRNTIIPILYKKYFDFLQYQTNRGRFFGDSFDEIIIPFIFLYLFHTNKLITKFVYILFINIILFIVIISNWRTKALMAFYSILSSLFIFRKELKSYLILFVISIIVFILAVGLLSNLKGKGGNVIDRLLLNEVEDAETIISRFAFWSDAVSMGLNNPITGVGLGNYLDNLSQRNKLNSMSSTRTGKFVLIDDPHNIFMSIFAETGVLGLIGVILMFVHFFISDVSIFKAKNTITQLTILSFWGLFIYSLLNPWLNLTYLIQIFFIRGMSERIRI